MLWHSRTINESSLSLMAKHRLQTDWTVDGSMACSGANKRSSMKCWHGQLRTRRSAIADPLYPWQGSSACYGSMALTCVSVSSDADAFHLSWCDLHWQMSLLVSLLLDAIHRQQGLTSSDQTDGMNVSRLT